MMRCGRGRAARRFERFPLSSSSEATILALRDIVVVPSTLLRTATASAATATASSAAANTHTHAPAGSARARAVASRPARRPSTGPWAEALARRRTADRSRRRRRAASARGTAQSPKSGGATAAAARAEHTHIHVTHSGGARRSCRSDAAHSAGVGKTARATRLHPVRADSPPDVIDAVVPARRRRDLREGEKREERQSNDARARATRARGVQRGRRN